MVFQRETLNSIDTPRPLAGLLLQAGLLRVDRKHGKLRLN